MSRLARWARLRVLAALLLLVLVLVRPCIAFFSAEFSSSQSDIRPQITRINDGIAREQLAVARRRWLRATVHRVVVNSPMAKISIAIGLPSEHWISDSEPVVPNYVPGLLRAFAGRAPPR